MGVTASSLWLTHILFLTFQNMSNDEPLCNEFELPLIFVKTIPDMASSRLVVSILIILFLSRIKKKQKKTILNSWSLLQNHIVGDWKAI